MKTVCKFTLCTVYTFKRNKQKNNKKFPIFFGILSATYEKSKIQIWSRIRISKSVVPGTKCHGYTTLVLKEHLEENPHTLFSFL
jgi:hypothetical protein